MPNSDDLIRAVGANIQEKASSFGAPRILCADPISRMSMVWLFCPMTVIKRFHDCACPHARCRDRGCGEIARRFAVKDGFLREASGYPFITRQSSPLRPLRPIRRTSRTTSGLHQRGSDNVQDILARMNFSDQVERLCDPDAPLLYQLVCISASPSRYVAQQDNGCRYGLHL